MNSFFFRLTVIFSIAYSVESEACSAFLLTGKDHNVVGFNENWKTMPGMIVINKRDVPKRNISWQNLTTDQTQAKAMISHAMASMKKVFFWLNYIWKKRLKFTIPSRLICSGHNGFSISWIITKR